MGEDGHVYEGRGWNKVGGHTLGYNSVAVAISFIGNFQNRNPNARAVAAAQNIIACGVRQVGLTFRLQYLDQSPLSIRYTFCILFKVPGCVPPVNA